MDYHDKLAETALALGLPTTYLLNTPEDFWTREAFDLFMAADEAGIIYFDYYTDQWLPGTGKPKKEIEALLNSDSWANNWPRITKGQLAYFCQRACRRLHLNKGAHTNWKPFEQMFNFKRGTMRSYLHNVEERSASGRLEDKCIDAFFESVKVFKFR